MVENQRVPKQLLSALLDNTQAPFPKEIINDMLESIIGQRYYGSERGRELFIDFKNSTFE